MCGILGYVASNNSTPSSLMRRMVDSLKHRGPDHQDVFIDRSVALGHTRLSILDLSCSGNQPMFSDELDFVIVFNGEIYNYQDLKRELKLNGFSFKTRTDTEVIIKGFQLWGPDIFKKLNGVFAVAIWDKRRSTMFLARDRFGVKPLYYAVMGETIVFASEIKAILLSKIINTEISWHGLHEFLYYGNALGSKTLFNAITKVQPGHYLEIKKDSTTDKAFWSINDISPKQDVTISHAVRIIRDKIEKAVERQLVSDVPVGIFLSGGIDSSCITAFASRHYNGKINTYSAAFDFDMGINELPKAKKIADFFKTNHHEIFIRGRDIEGIIVSLIRHHDEPFSDAANIPLYLLCEQVKKSHKVILQGDGGDEIFGGYRRYNILDNLFWWKLATVPLRLLNKMRRGIGHQRLSRMLDAINQPSDAMRMALLMTVETEKDPPSNLLTREFRSKVMSYDPFYFYKKMDDNFSHLDRVQKMLWTDTQIILPEIFLEKVDKATMAHGVEVRVPLLDNEITDFVLGLPSNFKVRLGNKKRLLKLALRGVVPDEILDAPKTGFGVPYSNWLRNPLHDFMLSVFQDTYIKDLGLFDCKQVERKIFEHRTGRLDHGFILWKLLNLCIWLKEYKITLNN